MRPASWGATSTVFYAYNVSLESTLYSFVLPLSPPHFPIPWVKRRSDRSIVFPRLSKLIGTAVDGTESIGRKILMGLMTGGEWWRSSPADLIAPCNPFRSSTFDGEADDTDGSLCVCVRPRRSRSSRRRDALISDRWETLGRGHSSSRW